MLIAVILTHARHAGIEIHGCLIATSSDLRATDVLGE
jgi:hypothetical protein